MRGRLALQPGITGAGLRLREAIPQAGFDRVRGVDRLLPDLLDAESLDEVVRALEIVGVLAVVLEEELRRLERLLGGLDRRQQIRLAHRLACGATDDHLPAAFDADEPDVLDRGLGTVARTADGG